eukprot:14545919-Ditylum_brightwellii.AAC.1
MLTLQYTAGFNLSVVHLDGQGKSAVHIGETIQSVVDDRNVGLTQNEKILMQYCYKPGHYFLCWIQSLMKTSRDGKPPVIPTPTHCHAHCCSIAGLLCASCQYGKGVLTGTGAKHTVEVELSILRANDLLLG